MDRKDKIAAIMKHIRPQMEAAGIDPELWIVAHDENHPDFDKWLDACNKMVDGYFVENGVQDTDSVFAEFVREYGMR